MFGKADTDYEKVGFMLLTDNAFVGVIGLPGEGHEQLPPNEKWDIKSYEEFAVDCAKKIVEYRADCEKYGTTMEELLKNFDDKMGALPEDDFQAASD